LKQATTTDPTTSWLASERVYVLALLERDSHLICQLLEKAGIGAESCSSASDESLASTLKGGCLIITEELLTPELIQSLRTLLGSQPPWSDFPLILLTQAGEVSVSTQKRRELRDPLGNVVLLERPIRPETLISTVQNTLRARRRQYQIRDQIEQYKRAEEALRRSEKLAVAGRLASSIAHEINNPLASVTNLLYLMQSTDSMDELQGYLKTAEHELARVSEITTNTLQFYRQTSRPGPVLLTEILDSALKLYYPRLTSAGIEVEKRFDTVPPVCGMSGELRQVFSNLVGNALDAMRSGGRLLLRAHDTVDYRNGMARGVRITIADTGLGIPGEVRAKIFEPFVTTKGDTGTGLGLWISAEIVQKHGGRIRLRSRGSRAAASGTAFSIFFPCDNNYGKISAAQSASQGRMQPQGRSIRKSRALSIGEKQRA
jgi:signal transduction histidine kinase